jgi:hypothetical protein
VFGCGGREHAKRLVMCLSVFAKMHVVCIPEGVYWPKCVSDVEKISMESLYLNGTPHRASLGPTVPTRPKGN